MASAYLIAMLAVTPSKSREVALIANPQFEAGLVAFLAKSRPPEDPDLYRKVGSYVRQYTGGTQDGRRLLFVTFACREDAGWGERFLVINDGGSCYFDVGYDLDAGAYTYVGVHHDA